MRAEAIRLAMSCAIEEFSTPSTAIHSNSQKEKEAKRKRNGGGGLPSSPPQQPQQHDILTWLNYMTFLNGLDNNENFLDKW